MPSGKEQSVRKPVIGDPGFGSTAQAALQTYPRERVAGDLSVPRRIPFRSCEDFRNDLSDIADRNDLTGLVHAKKERELILLEAHPRKHQLEEITTKWTLLVLDSLCGGPMRFNAIRRANPGVTQKALTQCLRRLEYNGFINRTVVRTRYQLDREWSPVGRRHRCSKASMDG